MKKYHYIKIHFGVLEMKEIKLSSKVVYSLLSYLSNIENPLTVKNQFLADKIGISIDTVKRAVKELKDNNLIEIDNNNRYRTIKVVEINEHDYLDGVLSDYKQNTDTNLTLEQENALDQIWQRL